MFPDDESGAFGTMVTFVSTLLRCGYGYLGGKLHLASTATLRQLRIIAQSIYPDIGLLMLNESGGEAESNEQTHGPKSGTHHGSDLLRWRLGPTD
jgi:hypothetical protein